MMPQEDEPMTIPMGNGDPLPREIQDLAEAEDASLLQNAEASDEEKSEIDARLAHNLAEERDDAPGDTAPL